MTFCRMSFIRMASALSCGQSDEKKNEMRQNGIRAEYQSAKGYSPERSQQKDVKAIDILKNDITPNEK